MDLYSIIIPRGQNCGLRLGQKKNDGHILVTNVFSTLEDGTINPLDGRIGIRDSIVKVNGHTLDGFDSLKYIIEMIKMPADYSPVRIVFRENSRPHRTNVLF